MVVECKNTNKGSKNTGAKEQCLEGVTIKTAVHVPGFSFPDTETAKSKAAWDAAIAAKKLFPLYEVEELATANTEDTFFEGRSRQYRTASGKKVSTYSSFLGACSHAALKSFNGKEMGLFELTEDGAVLGVVDEDGSIKGQDVVLSIGKRLAATGDRPPSTLVTINYKDFNQFEDTPAILRPDWGASDIFGIFDVTLSQVSATATTIKLTVSDGCAGGGEYITSFLAANFIVRDETGAVETVSFVAPDTDGVYTLTGTGIASGYTVELNGVVTQSGTSYESPEKLTLTVTP